MYSHKYQLTHDMDCYFNLNGFPIHIATNGGLVPDSLGTVGELQEIQRLVTQIDATQAYELNREYLSRLDRNSFPTQEEWNEFELDLPARFSVFDERDYELPFHWLLYSLSFVENARKGFFSFDRIATTWAGYDIYQLIAWPKSFHLSNSLNVGNHFRLKDCDDYYCGSVKCWPLVQMLKDAELRG